MKIHLRVLIFLALTISLIYPQVAYAQIEIIDTSVDYSFGEQIVFQAQVESSKPIETAVIFFQADQDSHTVADLASIKRLKNGTYELSYIHQLSDYAIRPFSRVNYHFEVVDKSKNTYESPPAEFYYEDNRFRWNTQADGPFKVHYHEGDIKFAREVLNVAQEGLNRVQSLLALPAPRTLDIYVYTDAGKLQDTLNPNSQSWIAGHADPDLGVVVVALPAGPEQRLLMEERIPHELMHIMLFQATDLGYSNLPTWLNEGLASIAEKYPNPDYRVVLENAIQNNSLLPIISLCNSFPRDASGALLSYAQAASFTRFLYNTYGTSGLNLLVDTYANGVDCDHGAKTSLGVGLTQLERQWRRDVLAQNITLTALNNLIPWIILMFVVLAVPLGLAISKLRRRPTNQTAA